MKEGHAGCIFFVVAVISNYSSGSLRRVMFQGLTLTHCKTLPHWTSQRLDAGGSLATGLLILSMTSLFLHHFHPSIFTSRSPPPSCRTQVASVLVRARACCATINRYRGDEQQMFNKPIFLCCFFLLNLPKLNIHSFLWKIVYDLGTTQELLNIIMSI